MAGLTVDGDTVWWCMKQFDAAGASRLTQRTTLGHALQDFAAWLPKNCCVWGNGATFDNVLLTAAYDAIRFTRPWHYRNDRDMRTLIAVTKILGLTKLDFDPIPFEGTKHDALADAKHQAKIVQAIMAKMKEMI